MFKNPVRLVILFYGLVLSVLFSGFPASASQTLAREFFSPSLERSFPYTVYLPDGYGSQTRDLPVLFLFHGHGGNSRDWIEDGEIQATADSLIAGKDIPPCVIIMPDAGSTWYVDRKEKMETAIMTELIPEAEKVFRISRQRSHRFVAGLSMGGYGAMRYALKFPERFAAAALLSPAIYCPVPPKNSSVRKAGVFGANRFDPDLWKASNYPALWKSYREKNLPVPMFILSGDDDEFLIESEAVRFYSLLRRCGQPAELRIVNGSHSWEVWKKGIVDALKYLFTPTSWKKR